MESHALDGTLSFCQTPVLQHPLTSSPRGLPCHFLVPVTSAWGRNTRLGPSVGRAVLKHASKCRCCPCISHCKPCTKFTFFLVAFQHLWEASAGMEVPLIGIKPPWETVGGETEAQGGDESYFRSLIEAGSYLRSLASHYSARSSKFP